MATPTRRPPVDSCTTPVRLSLRKLTGSHSTLVDDTEKFINHAYSSLDTQLVKAEVEPNKLNYFLVVGRKVKYYDPKIGPYDSVRLLVKEDGNFCLLLYDKTIGMGRIEAPCDIVEVLNKLANPHMVVCRGIQDYTVYKESIGYDISRVVLLNCPSDSVCDIECYGMYENKSTRRKSDICPKCTSLKWQLSRRKREHDGLTPSQREERQSSSSHVPFDVLSPASKKARVVNMQQTIHHLKSKVEYFSEKVLRIAASDKQNSEIGQLVDSICTSPHGNDSLSKIFSDADSMQHGLGETVKGIWEKDVSEWKCFVENQENNGKYGVKKYFVFTKSYSNW